MANDERYLLRGLAAGEADAYEVVYERFGPALYRAAARMLAGRADAEDAVQEVFTSLVRSRKHIGNVEDLQAYLFVSLRRAVGRLCQREQRLSKVCTDRPADANVDNEIVDDEMTKLLRGAIADLPEKQQEVISLKLDGELTFAQIGAVLDVSVNTAASRYRYALAKLRQMMEKHR